ncbi:MULTISPECIES: glycosyltransferase [unclassified Tolypothrix]|uniref:glycosyltransferase n=1 Tax=unclassified Tolypothrix TaxID=2649714 RepID=UPI0005EABB40|nr:MULTISPECIES: glycosyltransferase [unclassified Tolypothrix]BAY91193.1 glycosyl transferase family 28 [Microchaete diplosiphon NIES-3275]EKF00028.1 glycosyltransferase family 28 protein [Tolypothrix sp. PCC 7601]MBE9080839.1 glycosyltransferase family 1 protein [Tolypothrix sp. LEGE 11397]UYD25277.1 glycosyltransferase family 1 protein [Tolypothrix sp. PCC 7712]UYD32483.1 glycosyltransferase family 1 protein [Tolypothrix sp. PCC 7601]
MATIVISSTGTDGDHLPYIALGEALQARGHKVRMAFRESMRSHITKAGLEAICCGKDLVEEEARKDAADWDGWQPPSTSGQERYDKMVDYLQHEIPVVFQALLAACKDADLLICGLQRQLLGAMIEKKIGTPWVAASVTPAFQCSEIGHHNISNRSEVVSLFLPILKEVFTKLEVEEINWLEYHKTEHAILGSSSHFSQPTLENSHYKQTGFWFYENPDWQNWQPDEQLQEFVETSPKPLVLSFSSIPVTNPKSVLEVHVHAAAILGRRIVVQRGWANFNETLLPNDINRESVMFTEFMPQDWLLSHAAAFIHHGGVGTIARALRNDCPMLVEPLGNDQFFNAKRVLSLKVGTAMHPHKLTPDGLARVLETKVLNDEVKQNTQVIGAKIREDKGLVTACQVIESWLP